MVCSQLLDSGEITEVDGDDVSLSPSKRKRSWRKPLPATYEPGENNNSFGALCRHKHRFLYLETLP